MMINFTNPTWRERVAVHEAGHAVVAALSSAHPVVESVVLDNEWGGGGHCAFRDDPLPPDAPIVDRIGQSIRARAAGAIAEALAFGCLDQDILKRGPNGEARDAHNIVRLAALLREQHEADFHAAAAGVAFAPCYDAAAREADERRALSRLAGELAVAEFILRERWGAVVLVAERLLQLGTMPGYLVRTLIETAPEKAKQCATIEEEYRLLAKAGAADPALGAAILRVLDAAA